MGRISQRSLRPIQRTHAGAHLTAAGECSWHEFAVEIFRLMNLTPEVSPVTSDHYPTRAKRPPYSALDNAAYRAHGFKDLLPWREALAEYIAGRAANGRD